MTKLEKAARAVAGVRRADDAAWGLLTEEVCYEPPLTMDFRVARAVIEAIREADAATIAAGVKGSRTNDLHFERGWKDGIDAILKGEAT